MADWLEAAAAGIVRDWPRWEDEARALAEQERDPAAGTSWLVACVKGSLKWARANHESPARKGGDS